MPRDTEYDDNMLSRQAQVEISEQLRKTEEITVVRVITSDSSESEWGTPHSQTYTPENRNSLMKCKYGGLAGSNYGT